MNQNEKELLDAYNSLSDQEAAKLKPEELTEYEQLMAKSKLKPEDKSQGFNYGTNNPEQQRDIATSLFDKVKVYGYSGLSDSDKDMFNKQYSYSQAARKGMSQKEVQDYADINASGTPIGGNDKRIGFDLSIRNPIEAASNVGQLVREGLSVPAGLIAGTASYAKDRMFNEGDWAAGEKPWTEYFKEALGLGSKSEGLAGVLADPANIVGAALPIAKSASFITRAGLEGLKGGGLAAISDLSSGNTVDLGRNIGVGALLGAGIGGLATVPAAKQGLQKAEAIRTFPGAELMKRENAKSGILEEEGINYLHPNERIDLLRQVKYPYDKQAWINLERSLDDRAQAGYDAVNEIAKTYKGLPGAEIPVEELKSKIKNHIKKNTDISYKDIDRMVDQRFAGYKDRNIKSIPVHELGKIKSKFNADIFDDRHSVVEGTENKRNMARQAGSVLEDYRENRPAYVNPIDKSKATLDEQLQDLTTEASQRVDIDLSKLTEEQRSTISENDLKDLLGKHLRDIYSERQIPYNSILQQIAPESKELFRKHKILAKINQKVNPAVGTKRVGSGLGRLFEGATHMYVPAGDAFKDPVLLLRHSEKPLPTILGKGGVGIGFELGRDIDYSMRKKK